MTFMMIFPREIWNGWIFIRKMVTVELWQQMNDVSTDFPAQNLNSWSFFVLLKRRQQTNDVSSDFPA